jgi:hypothetical protein
MQTTVVEAEAVVPVPQAAVRMVETVYQAV